jgi:hypothetical protein
MKDTSAQFRECDAEDRIRGATISTLVPRQRTRPGQIEPTLDQNNGTSVNAQPDDDPGPSAA